MIFGIAAGKFTNTAETATVLFVYDVLSPSWTVPREIENESVINAHREWTDIGSGYDHAEFSVLVHIFKEADPAAKFTEIYAYNHSDVYFYPHADKDALQDSAGAKVKFHITQIEPFCLEEPWYDVLRVIFKSKDPVDLIKNITGVLLSEDGTPITSEGGTEIILG